MGIIKHAWPCQVCFGTGIHTYINGAGQTITENPCYACGGDGIYTGGGGIEDTQVQQLITKIDAIKAMLDSPTLGMQKMSSNLDDIMVKLDV